MGKRVIIESPFAGGFANVKYGRQCVRDSIDRGESPFASHLLFTQKGILDDSVASERALGISAADGWLESADHVAIYLDLGLTVGMVIGLKKAFTLGKPIHLRYIKDKRPEQVIE